MPVLELDGIETCGNTRCPIGVAGEEDVLGQLAGAESDVVLPFSHGECDAVIRVRQDL